MVPYVTIASLAALGACLSGCSPSSQDCSASWRDYMAEVSNKPSAESWGTYVANHSLSKECKDSKMYGLETRGLKGKLTTAHRQEHELAEAYLQKTKDLKADDSNLEQLKSKDEATLEQLQNKDDSNLQQLKSKGKATLEQLQNKDDSNLTRQRNSDENQLAQLKADDAKLKQQLQADTADNKQLKADKAQLGAQLGVDEAKKKRLSEMEKKSMTCPTTRFYTYSDSEYRKFVEHWDYEYDSKPFDFTHALCVLKKVNSPTSWDCDEYFKEVNSEYVLKHLFLPDTQKCTCPDGKPPTKVTGKTYYPSYGIQHHLAYYYTDLTYLYAHPHEC